MHSFAHPDHPSELTQVWNAGNQLRSFEISCVELERRNFFEQTQIELILNKKRERKERIENVTPMLGK